MAYQSSHTKSRTSDLEASSTCGSLHGPGPRVTFKGAALGDGVEDAIDPYEAQIARCREIARAPQRLRDGFKRRAENNYSCAAPTETASSRNLWISSQPPAPWPA